MIKIHKHIHTYDINKGIQGKLVWMHRQLYIDMGVGGDEDKC